VFFDVFPVSALREVDGMESALEVMHEMRHKTAGELMGKAEVVRMDDTVHDVFVRMHRVGVSSRPIVDRNDRAAGDLDLCVRAAL
jgi:predicted transcriptional regulator